MKTRVFVIALLAISATVLTLAASNTFVFAQACTATLSYPIVPTQYGSPNTPLVVPVSASCTTYYGSQQLYATGTAYDTTSNTGLGSASTILSSVNGGTQFNGQLDFNQPPTSPSDYVQISVSIYDSQGGSLLTTTGETTQVGAGPQEPVQVSTTTVTVGEYPYANAYPTAYPEPNQSQYYQLQPQYQQQYQGHHSHSYHVSEGIAGGWNNSNLLDYIVIITIIAAVIIATTGLVLIARRQPPPQPVWYPAPPPPSR